MDEKNSQPNSVIFNARRRDIEILMLVDKEQPPIYQVCDCCGKQHNAYSDCADNDIDVSTLSISEYNQHTKYIECLRNDYEYFDIDQPRTASWN
jgi:hypothetical protein